MSSRILCTLASLVCLTAAACGKGGEDDQPSAAATNAAVADTGHSPAPPTIPNTASSLPNSGAWLDARVRSWNVAGASFPKAPTPNEPGIYAPRGRCYRPAKEFALPSSSKPTNDSAAVTASTQVVTGAGWSLITKPRVFHNTVVIFAAVDADGMCRPFKYQTFVFENGVYAGTLSPHTMDSRTDGDIMEVTARDDRELTASFKRYKASDPLCCASGHTVVHYRIQREDGYPIAVPASMKTVANISSQALRESRKKN